MPVLNKPANLFAASAIAAAALAGGVGFAFAQDSSTATPDSVSSSAAGGAKDQGKLGQRGMNDNEGKTQRDQALADKLGVSVEQLQSAMEKVRPQEGQQPQKPADGTAGQDQFASKLAGALGKDEASVKSAMDSLRQEENAKHRDEMAQRLDSAVSEGKITDQDKASILKAFDAGVLGGFGGHHGGGHAEGGQGGQNQNGQQGGQG